MARRILPKLFPILAAVSLALAVGVAGVWARSYRRYGDCVISSWGTHLSAATSVDGRIALAWVRDTFDAHWTLSVNPPNHPWNSGPPYGIHGPRPRWFGVDFGLGSAVYNPGVFGAGIWPSYALIVPHWMILLSLSILPAVWLRRFRSERRKQQEGLCLVCGYDLRAHSPGQVCPECGTAVPADLVRKPMEQTP